jgi:hypothetical protein
MDAVDQGLIERECERLINRYCHLIDHGEAAQVADLFVEDGVWANPEVTRDGRAAIAKGFGARQANGARRSRHVCSTALIEVIDDANARGVTYLTLYRHDGEPGRAVSPLDGLPEVVGEYCDVFVRTSDGWRFKRREFVRAFVRKASREPRR